MQEEKVNALDKRSNNIFNRWRGYTRTKTDIWIDGAAMCLWLCSGLFLIIALLTLSFVFLGLMLGAWFIASILWSLHIFRRMLWEAQKREQQRSTPTSKMRHILMGTGLILTGILCGIGANNLHNEWLFLLAKGGTVLILGGLVEIVQAVKSKNKRG